MNKFENEELSKEEKELLDFLKNEEVEIPDSLKPDAISKKLEGVKQKPKRIKSKVIFSVGGLAAACFVVVVGVNALSGNRVVEVGEQGKNIAISEKNINETKDQDVYEYFEKVKKQQDNRNKTSFWDRIFNESSDTKSMDMVESSQEDAGSTNAKTDKETSNYKTNVQTQGVDEGDVVKCDGNYIYMLEADENIVKIYKVDGKKSTFVTNFDYKNEVENVSEMYLDQGYLTLIGEKYETNNSELEDSRVDAKYSEDTCVIQPSKVVAVSYDVRNPEQAVKVRRDVQEGSLVSSRKVGDYVYLISNVRKNISALSRDKKETYYPSVNDKTVNAKDIWVPNRCDDRTYVVVSCVSVKDKAEKIVTKAAISSGLAVYASEKNIYICSPDYEYNGTEILKYAYDKNEISLVKKGRVEGYVNNSFSLDEYENNLRIVTTSERHDNCVYILDKELNVTGKLKNIAEGEEIKSARFMKNTGYFVTYRNTDPLFAVDLSNPQKPELKGYLKVTGFSSYLHFYKDHYLVGLGYEIDPDTQEQKGIKLSLFDIKDPTKPVEVTRKVFGDYTYYAEALDNHKALYFDDAKGQIGFSYIGHADEDTEIKYALFHIDEKKGFTTEFVDNSLQNQVSLDDSNSTGIRGLMIQNQFFVVYSQDDLVVAR